MADSSARPHRPPPLIAAPGAPADGDAPAPAAAAPEPEATAPGSRLQRPGSRRARFESPTSAPPSPSPSPSPSRRNAQEERKSLQDQLLQALLDGDLPTFEELVRDKRVDKRFKYPKPHHATCLEIACRKPNRSQFVQLLLQYVKPNINHVIPEPIHYAAQKGHSDTLSVLLSDKRTKVYLQNSKGQTALHLACTHVHADRVDEYEKCVSLLVPKMSVADLNKPDGNGFTAFHALVRGPGKRQSLKGRATPPGDGSSGTGAGPRDGDAAATTADADARERLAKQLLQLSHGTLDVDSVRARGRTAREDVELRFPRLRAQLPARREQQPRADPHAALVDALRDGRLELFRALLEQTDADGNPALDPNHAFGYPLHTTCLELACEREDRAPFVQALLEAGADPNAPNKLNEKYPIHVACEKGHHKELDALLRYSKVIVDLNCEDKFGNTPLHCAVDRISDDKRRETGRRECLKILLRYPTLDVRRMNKAGYTALLLAVEDGNKSIIKTFLGSNTHFPDVNIERLRLDAKDKSLRASISEQFPQLEPLLQGPDGLQTLRVHRGERTKQLFQCLNPLREDEFVEQLSASRPRDLSSMNDKTFTLLQRAVRYGMARAVQALLDARVDPNDTCPGGNQSPPVVLATLHRHLDVLGLLVEHAAVDVNRADAKGNTALHYAARADKGLETVVLLLRRGADPARRNKLGRSPFGPLQVEALLDQCVRTNGKNSLEEDYELVLDYRLLAAGPHRQCDANNRYMPVPQNNVGFENGVVQMHPANNPPECGKLVTEMDFLNMMSKDDELSALLDHPVALTFLQLKWNRLRILTYFNLCVYIFFMLFLNTYIVLGTGTMTSEGNNTVERIPNASIDERRSDRSLNHYSSNKMIPFCVITLVFWVLLALRELSQIILDSRKYIKSWENYLDWALLIFSLSSLLLPFTGASSISVRCINVVTIMLSCIELLLLLGRISHFAKYIEMLKVVITNYLLPLVSYSVILVAFGLSFFALCHERSVQTPAAGEEEEKKANFDSWYMSIVSALVMMIGEVELESLPKSRHSPWLSVVLFVFFVLLVTVVLLNLLTGLAVSDTARIERAAQRLQLRSRVGVVVRSERILVNMHNAECAASRCLALPVPACARRWLRRAVLFPGAALEGREARVKPNHTGELALGAGDGGGERRWATKRSLDRATQIISRRGAAAARALTLEDVDARVQEVLKVLSVLEARCGPGSRAEARGQLYSAVFSEAPDDWEPLTPGPDAASAHAPATTGDSSC